MIWQALIYLVVAIAVALVVAAYDNGERWGVGKCLLIGATWPLSLLIGLYYVIRQKIGSRR